MKLGGAVVPANVKGFRRRGLGMGYNRIVTRQDRAGDPPLRTWGDRVARWYFGVTVLAVLALWASSRGWLPIAWWEAVRQALLARLAG